jgi:hypothetical protein
MDTAHLRNITNHFLDVHLLSLRTWKAANEIFPRDHGGPYVVMQEGYDPEDMEVRPDEFVLGRSGKWMSLSMFYRMPVKERREEFVFGTAAEVMGVMQNLPSKAKVMRPPGKGQLEEVDIEQDPMAKAIEAERKKAGR